MHKLLGVTDVYLMTHNMSYSSYGVDEDDATITTSAVKTTPYTTTYTHLSSFLDLSWTSWGKDTTQFETLLPPSELDFSIDK